MKLKYTYLIIGMFFSSQGICQIDSSYVNNKLDEYSRLANINIDSAEYNLYEAIRYSDSTGYFLGRLKCTAFESHFYSRKSKYRKAIEIATIGLNKCTSDNTDKYEIIFSRFIGNQYRKLLEFEKAEKYYDKALEKAIHIKDSSKMAKIYFNYATLFEMQNKYDKSIEYYHKSQDIEFAIGDTKSVSDTYTNLAILFKKMKDYDRSKEYIRKAINLDQNGNNKYGLISDFMTLAGIYYDQSYYVTQDSILKIMKLDSAIVYYKKANEIANELKSNSREISATLNIGIIFYELKRYEESLIYLNKAESLVTNSVKLSKIQNTKCYTLLKLNRIKESIALHQKVGLSLNPNEAKDVFQNYYKFGADIHEKNKDFKIAYAYLEKAYNLRDTIYQEKLKSKILETEAKYQTKLQKSENLKLKQEQIITKTKLKTQQLYTIVTLAGLLIIGLLSLLFYRTAKQRKHYNEILNDKNQELKDYNQELISALKVENNKPKNLLKQEITLSDRQKTTIKLEDILYIESKNKAIFVHTNKGKSYKDWQSLKSYSEILPDSIFQRVNRSTIINSTHIVSRQKSKVSLLGGIDISIGAAYTNEEE